MRLLVTGGAGFIGHHVVNALAARGDDVVVLDDLSSGRLERLAGVKVSRIVEADIRSGPGLPEALQDREVVVHLAAIASVVESLVDPVKTNAVNVDGTIRLMVEAATAGVRRVVLASSSAVYGGSPHLPSRESHLAEPLSPYATSKLAAEHYTHNLGVAHRIETVALRYFNVFGPGQDPGAEYAAVVPRFVMAALRADRPVVYGDGHQSRDFTFIDDVVSANLSAIDRPDVAGLTANIGSGKRSSLLDLLDAVGAAVGRPLDPRFEEARPGDVRDSQADVTLAAERLGYRAAVDLMDGIRRTTAWYRESNAVPVVAGT